MRTLIRLFVTLSIATALCTTSFGTGVVTASAAPLPQFRSVVVRVVDADGLAQVPATALACPYVGDAIDCSQPTAVVREVGAAGFAVLRLDRAIRYDVFAYVSNPDPAWACPGFPIGDDELYLSDTVVTGTGADLPRLNRLTIAEPSPYDCAPITVTDQYGTPVPSAGLFVDDGFANGLTDQTGVMRIAVEPGTTYTIGAFVANIGWPCPFVWGDDEFHFSPSGQFTAEQLIDGETFVIERPDADDCAPTTSTIEFVDEAGSPVQGTPALVGYCAYQPGSPPSYPVGDGAGQCADGYRFVGPDANGVVQFDVDTSLDYDLGGFLPCAGGGFLFTTGDTTDNGYVFTRISGADLAGETVTLTIVGDVSACLGPT